MTKTVHTILMPLLIISYVFGLRIANLSKHSRLWFSILYILLIWSIYYFFFTSALTFSNAYDKFSSIEYNSCLCLEVLTTFITIIFGIYHNKAFQNCLKKFNIVDDTLLKLGSMTDYDKLYKKTVWLALGWFMIVILTTYSAALFVKNEYNCDIATAMFFTFMRDYCFHINLIGDLTTASILEYIGLKFDQVNEQVQNLMNNNKRNIKQACKNSLTHPHQRRFSKTLSNKGVIWIVIHLHLELRKISYEIDSIFGKQVSLKMVCYFGWIANDLRAILYTILINNYVKDKITTIALHFICLSNNISKFLLINYMCEIVTNKASVTADLLNKLSSSTCNSEIREIISQFSLRIVYAPLKFCGIGLYQFGFRFLRKFAMSIATLLVIIIQAHKDYSGFHGKMI